MPRPLVFKPHADYPFVEGDKARFTTHFLRSTGQYTDPHGTHGWATVSKVENRGDRAVVTLQWPNGHTQRVLDSNLQKHGAPLRLQDLPE